MEKMASKAFKDLKSKLTGQKYHSNLLGQSLEDMLRIATAKSLEASDATTNQQVVDTINNDVASGKDPKEIAGLLKARLRMDNPQKQFLAVNLVEQVMTDCREALAPFQQELLQEVARVMARPSKPDTGAGKRARQAAKELLRKYGQEGNNAFRAVQAGQAVQAQRGAPVVMPGQYVVAAPASGGTPFMSVETQSIIDEVRQLIDKAKSNTELLSDMLVTTGAPDEFEAELIKDLLNEVHELRDLFSAYLEQIGSMEGAEVEALLVQALEATDMLDGAMALQKDVALSLQEELAARGPSTSAGGAAAAAAGTSGTAEAAQKLPAPQQNTDLIALDDLAEALTASAAAAAGQQVGPAAAGSSSSTTGAAGAAAAPAVARQASVDPFAASDLFLMGSTGVPAPAAAVPPAAAAAAAAGQLQPQQQQQQQPSAFDGMFMQPHAYASLAAAAPHQATASPGGIAPTGQYQLQQQQYSLPEASSQYSQQYMAGMPAAQQSSQLPTASSFPPHVSGNPFITGGPGPTPASSFLSAAPLPSSASNPFAGAPPAQTSGGGSLVVDHEWDLFFADRAGAAQAQAQATRAAGVL